MKFPRNARIFRGQLDAAPFIAVFFLLVMFLMLGSLLSTPGIHLQLQLPTADNLPGTDKPIVAVAVDSSGRWYYQNQAIDETRLRQRLSELVKQMPEPPVLVVQADKSVTADMLVRLSVLARGVGITNGLLATLPRPIGPAL